MPSGLFGGIAELAVEADNLSDCCSKLGNRHVLAPADINVLLAGIILHQEHKRVGEIVNVQEFAPRPTGAPNLDFRSPLKLCMVRS